MKVAIIGAGGIGFDVAEFLLDPTVMEVTNMLHFILMNRTAPL